MGIPQPGPRAIYSRDSRGCVRVSSIRTAQLVDQFLHVTGQIAARMEQFLAHRVFKPQLGCVQRLPGEGLTPGSDAFVLTKYAEANEITAPGKALYKIAPLDTLTLRAYITGNQLPTVKLNQPVQVLVDNGNGGYKTTTGTIKWISSKAEYTPKTIQTKEERQNLVYAIKIKVPNDGYLKIGMYGEVKLKGDEVIRQ